MSGEDKCMIDNMDLLGSSPLDLRIKTVLSTWDPTSLGHHILSHIQHVLSISCSGPALLPCLILCPQLGTTKAQEDT